MVRITTVLCLFFVFACGSEYVCPDTTPTLAQSTSFAQESGYLNSSSGNLFYWLTLAKQNSNTAPVVLWMNGGPGSSSLLGFFFENGPYRIQPDLKILESNFSWNENVNMLYIDQPAGVGYSLTTRTPQNESDMAEALLEALKDFFVNKHPELKANRFFVFGESFAGTYIPWLAEAILADATLPLKGIAIGDGTVDMLSTWETVAEYAYLQNLISAADRDYIQAALWPKCQAHPINSSEPCNALASYVQAISSRPNVYDIRQTSTYDNTFAVASCYLNKDSIKSAVHADLNTRWHQDTSSVFSNLTKDASESTKSKLASIRTQIPILIYSGDQDLLINYIGTEKWVSEFVQGTLQNWILSDGTLAGLEKSLNNFRYVRVFGAGHMVPMDQPKAAKELLESFVLKP